MRLPTWVGALVAAYIMGCGGGDSLGELSPVPPAVVGAEDGVDESVERPTATVIDWSTVVPPPDVRFSPMDSAVGGAGDGGMKGVPEVLPVPEADFGLVCGTVTCRAVAEPAVQCCTEMDDVAAQRAPLDRACGVAPPDRQGCYGLEQLGLPDMACPSQPSTVDPETMLAGCCMDSGRCGVFEPDFGIGCRGDPAVSQECGSGDSSGLGPVTGEPPGAPTGPGPPVPPASDGEPSAMQPMEPAGPALGPIDCDIPGVYATRVSVDVAYQDRTPLLQELAPGRGEVEILLRGVVAEVQADGDFQVEFQPCGLTVPVLRSPILCESFHIVFEPTIFASDAMPRYQVSGNVACGRAGCRLSFSPTTAALGIALEDLDGPWPDIGEADSVSCAAGEGVERCFPDQDDDGQPGITARLVTGGTEPDPTDACSDGYRLRGVPLAPELAVLLQGGIRSDQMAVAMRVRIGGAAVLSDGCAAEGQAVADFVNSRAIACMRQEGTSNLRGETVGPSEFCTDAELAYLDMNMPVYEVLQFGERPTLSLPEAQTGVSLGPRLRWRRLGGLNATATCEDVRELFAAGDE